MLVFLTLLVAILVAGCFRTPSSPDAHQQQQRQNTTRKGTAAAVPSRPMSVRAKALQNELGLNYGSPVTMATHGVILPAAATTTPVDAYSFTSGFIPQALDALRLLLEFADVFLIVHTAEGPAGDAEQARVLALLRREGLVREVGGQKQQQQQQGVAAHVR